MILKRYDNQIAEYWGSKVITAVYKGSQLVWSAIKSCFGKGYWINEQPWSNIDAWVN